MALDFFAGCLGGCAGVLVGHPFDTVKVLLQTQDSTSARYRGTFHCIKTVIKEESVRGLYKGMSSPLAGLACINAIVFGTYGNLLRATSNPNSLASHFFAGGAAGFVQSIIASPMELAKLRIQIQEQNRSKFTPPYRINSTTIPYNNPWDCIKKVAKAEGIKGVFRGLGCTILRDTPACAIYFSGFEYLTKMVADESGKVDTLSLLITGGIAGVLSWIALYPTDVIKSRIQADGMNGPRKYHGIWDCVKKTYQAEGTKGFARGLNSTVIRAFPTNAATFAVFTWVFMFCETHAQIKPRVDFVSDELHVESKLHRIAAYLEACA